MIKRRKSRLWTILVLFAVVFIPACNPTATTGNNTMTNAAQNESHNVEHNHNDDHEHEDEHNRVPNNGAVIRLISPEDGVTLAAGEDLVVEIETENITVGEEGNHWHVYVDGASWGMVMGRNTSEVVRGLEPGEHNIEVYLSIETHEELKEGDGITITVVE